MAGFRYGGYNQRPLARHVPVQPVRSETVALRRGRSIQGNDLFPSDVIEAAQAAQSKWGIPASISLAQWGLESSFGRRMPANSFNPFGIKATKKDIENGNSVDAMTWEVINGRNVHLPQPFRKFANFAEAFDYHGKLLANGSAYSIARSKLPDPYGFANGLTGHYATDPNYGVKLIDKFIKPYNLTQYDTQ
ncbi:UNVERIFIED_ORG: flagellum-specific peptidoglycan hydrolase FlgJ [Burkholderia sp. CF145]|nr:Flagellum-specific peptidoglycan hydrolase FlgJ [Paraburkholderia hospita]